MTQSLAIAIAIPLCGKAISLVISSPVKLNCEEFLGSSALQPSPPDPSSSNVKTLMESSIEPIEQEKTQRVFPQFYKVL